MRFYMSKIKKALHRKEKIRKRKNRLKIPQSEKFTPYGWKRNFVAFTPVTKNLGVNHSCHRSKLALTGVIFTPV